MRERPGEEVERARRHRTALSCVMLGIDGLRAITARYGSHFGDTPVRHLAQIYLGEYRRSDRVGRLAEGEFAILLPGTGGPYTESVARRALARLHEIRIESGLEREQLTASVGAAVWQETESAEDLLARAERAMRSTTTRSR